MLLLDALILSRRRCGAVCGESINYYIKMGAKMHCCTALMLLPSLMRRARNRKEKKKGNEEEEEEESQ